MTSATVKILILISSILFQDNFNDGNADGWFTVGPSTYTVLNQRYSFSGGGAVNDATSYRGDTGEYMSTPDYSVKTDVEIDVGIFGGLMVRYSEGGLYNLMLVLSVAHQALRLYRWHWSSIELLDSYPFPVQTGTTYVIRMQCNAAMTLLQAEHGFQRKVNRQNGFSPLQIQCHAVVLQHCLQQIPRKTRLTYR